MKAFMTLVLGLFLAGCAGGESNGADSTTMKEATTAKGAEETTVLEAQGNPSRPPVSTLSYGGREVTGSLASSDWAFSGSVGTVAADEWYLVPPERKTLTVPSGSEMVFGYGGQKPPNTVEVHAWPLGKKGGPSHPKAHGTGVERTIPAELPPGEYVLEVSVKEQRGNAFYFFRIIVD